MLSYYQKKDSIFFLEMKGQTLMDNLKLIKDSEILIASLSGEIDHHSAVRVRREIDEALYLYLPKTLVIDIGSVAFMDSSGLGLIMGRFAKAKEIGTALIVRDPSPRAKKMLMLAGLEKLIET